MPRCQAFLPAQPPVERPYFSDGIRPFAWLPGPRTRDRAAEAVAEAASKNRIKHLEADPDLAPLKGEPRFEAMVADAKRRLGMSS